MRLNQQTGRFFQVINILVVLAFLAGCSSNSVTYWVPPSSFSPPIKTLQPELTSSDMGGETQNSVSSSTVETEITAGIETSQVTSTELEYPTAKEIASPSPPPEVVTEDSAPILYYAQAADTLPAVAVRFRVEPAEISSQQSIPEEGFIPPGQLLVIPHRISKTTSNKLLLPDSEIVYSPSALDFDTSAFVKEAGGYLATKTEWHKSTGVKPGVEVLKRVAIENSINPRLLLALLEYHSHWVYGQPENQDQESYPLGYRSEVNKQLYLQLVWTVNMLSTGYYAYREGRLTDIQFLDGTTARLAPDLNAGTAALQYYFAQLYEGDRWEAALNPNIGFPALFSQMFGDPWERAKRVEPLYPPDITQPPLILPFARKWTWSYTGGPHGAWEQDGAFAALDFAPGANSSGCVESQTWVTAPSDGLVVRTGPGLVVLDIDGDGREQTGWVVVVLHVATKDRIPVGSWVGAGDPLGHPSCEGGFATGTHVHIARKFNGEWVPADGPLPFNLGGWIAHAGEAAYKGKLTRGNVTLEACTCSNYKTFITRTDNDP